MRRLHAAACAVSLLLAGRALGAQAAFATGGTPNSSPLIVEIANRTVGADSAEAGRTLTLALGLRASFTQSTTVLPSVAVPAGWRVVGGTAPMSLSSHRAELWTAGLTVPRATRAGTYDVVVTFAAASDTARQVLRITVPGRPSLQLASMGTQSHAHPGNSYEIRFAVRNSGNVDLALALSARSTAGEATLSASSMAAAAGSVGTVTATVRLPRSVSATVDVVEVTARSADGSVRLSVTERVTIVESPGRGSGRFATVPAELRLARTNGDQRVTPAELSGGGTLDGSSTRVDFVLRAPAPSASVFTAPDEYRLSVRGERFSVLLGDQTNHLSPLTSGGSAAFGIGGEVTGGRYRAAAYSGRARRTPISESENGVSFGVRDLAGLGVHGSLNAVHRTGPVSGDVASAVFALPLGEAASAEAEYAASRGRSGVGSARRGRLFGRVQRTDYDFSYQASDVNFAGPQRGGGFTYAGLARNIGGGFRARAYSSRYSNERLPDTLLSIGQSRTGFDAVAVDVPGGLSVEVGRGLRTPAPDASLGSSFRYLRTAATRTLGPLAFNGTASIARANDTLGASRTVYREISLSPSLAMRGHTVGLSYSRMLGSSGAFGTTSTNASAHARVKLPRRTTLTLNALAWHPADEDQNWGVQGQAQISHTLSSGGTLGLRVYNREVFSHDPVRLPGERIYSLEYSLPLRVPVARERSAGRVTARVVGDDGAPVSGAIVWLGDRAVVTNRSGHAHFSRVRAGHHSVTVSPSAQRVAGGSSGMARAEITVDSSSGRPVEFSVQVGEGGRVAVSVHSIADRTQLAQEPDSVRNPEPLIGMVVMLISGRDSLYQITDASGSADFGRVRAGRWTAIVVGGPPVPFAQWNPERFDVNVKSGESSHARFLLVSRKRNVIPAPDSSGEETPPVVLKLSARPSTSGESRP